MKNKLLIILILSISIFSLLLVFPNLNRESTNKKIQENVLSYVDYAKNLCIALCMRVNNTYNISGSCLSDKDTITGKYWIYPNISCYVESPTNPCYNKGIVEIELYTNCSVKKISFTNTTSS